MILSVPISLGLLPLVLHCLPVEGDRILARDAVPAIPEFASLSANLSLGYSPAPGLRRVFTAAALQAVAKSQGVEVALADDVCFELRQVELRKEDIQSAMRPELGEPEPRIELQSFGPALGPPGQIVFPRGGLQLPAGTDPNRDALWRGYVAYGANRRFGIWARVRVAFPTTQVVAVAEIPAGTLIRENQIQVIRSESPTRESRMARQPEDVVGFASRKTIRAGSPVDRSQLTRLPEIAKGDAVEVRVSSGSAQLILEGRAETAGFSGNTILVKNPTSGKAFRAKVTGKGTVSVVAPVSSAAPVTNAAASEGTN